MNGLAGLPTFNLRSDGVIIPGESIGTVVKVGLFARLNAARTTGSAIEAGRGQAEFGLDKDKLNGVVPDFRSQPRYPVWIDRKTLPVLSSPTVPQKFS